MTLRDTNYAHYLSLWLVPADRRDLALALFALEAELRAIPEKVTEPTLGLMRIVWWRDAVAEGATRAHPLLQGLQPHLRGQAGTVADWVETFDAPFVDETEREERLQERGRLMGLLLGEKAARFLRKAEKVPHAKPLGLIFRLIREII